MNVIEEVFKKSEDGKLSYEDFKKFSEGMKLVDLSKGEYVSKQKFDDEVNGLNSQVSTLNETIKTRDTDLADLQKKLEAAGSDATKLAELNTNFTDLQAKYDKDVKDYQDKLAAQKYEFAVNTYANGKKFTSGAAKRDFVRSLMDSKLAMEGENIVGIEDFTTKYSTDNADAFVVDNPNPNPGNENKLPTFAASTQQGNNPPSGSENQNPFGWHFSGVR